MIFSIAMGADYSFYVKSIATYAPAFFWYNNSILATVARSSLLACVPNISPAKLSWPGTGWAQAGHSAVLSSLSRSILASGHISLFLLLTVEILFPPSNVPQWCFAINERNGILLP